MKIKKNIIEWRFFKDNKNFICFVDTNKNQFYGYLKDKDKKRLYYHICKFNYPEKIDFNQYFEGFKFKKSVLFNLIYARNSDIIINIQILNNKK